MWDFTDVSLYEFDRHEDKASGIKFYRTTLLCRPTVSVSSLKVELLWGGNVKAAGIIDWHRPEEIEGTA